MNSAASLSYLLLSLTACGPGEAPKDSGDDATPVISMDASHVVLEDEDITYAEGLGHDGTSTSPFAIPQKLDVYYPDNDATNRPVYMFIHGGGFTGGSKNKPEIEEMADHFASRGWVFVSIDYRTVEELGSIVGMTTEEVAAFYTGIAPQQWVNTILQLAKTKGDANPEQIQQGIAMYAAQRDAKAALRWIVANADTYNINTDFITVGGASAGAITTVALGISNPEDFRDEMSIDDDPTLSTTNLDETYTVQSMTYFWGSNMKLELLEAVYGVDPYDANDPELFMAHGTDDQNPTTAFSEATELQEIYDSLGIYNELVPLDGEDHGAWDAVVDGQGLFEMCFDFVVSRQGLRVE